MEQRTDHEILLLLAETLSELKRQFDNHLRHHFAITVISLAAGLAGITNLGIALLIFFIRAN